MLNEIAHYIASQDHDSFKTWWITPRMPILQEVFPFHVALRIFDFMEPEVEGDAIEVLLNGTHKEHHLYSAIDKKKALDWAKDLFAKMVIKNSICKQYYALMSSWTLPLDQIQNIDFFNRTYNLNLWPLFPHALLKHQSSIIATEYYSALARDPIIFETLIDLQQCNSNAFLYYLQTKPSSSEVLRNVDRLTNIQKTKIILSLSWDWLTGNADMWLRNGIRFYNSAELNGSSVLALIPQHKTEWKEYCLQLLNTLLDRDPFDTLDRIAGTTTPWTQPITLLSDGSKMLQYIKKDIRCLQLVHCACFASIEFVKAVISLKEWKANIPAMLPRNGFLSFELVRALPVNLQDLIPTTWIRDPEITVTDMSVTDLQSQLTRRVEKRKELSIVSGTDRAKRSQVRQLKANFREHGARNQKNDLWFQSNDEDFGDNVDSKRLKTFLARPSEKEKSAVNWKPTGTSLADFTPYTGPVSPLPAWSAEYTFVQPASIHDLG